VEKIRVSSKCGLLAVASVLLLAICFSGCGAVSYSSGGTTTTPPPGISISMSTAPPSTIAPNGTATIAATVSNDSANGGVDWSCTPAGTCGTFNPAHTASGATTTFTAPAAGGSIMIVATSSSNHSAVASATVTVSSSGTLTIAMTGAPATLATGATATLTATVQNDAANAGVDWTCGPTAGTCGTFNPAHSASGANTTFTAPAGAGNVTVTATSTSNHAVSQSSTISITAGTTTTAAGALTSGTFVFTVAGVNNLQRNIAVAGAVVLDANGKVTSGEENYVSHDGPASFPPGDLITGGQLTTSSNGKGTLTVITNNTALGVNGTETFSVAVVNSKHAVISEFDSSATAVGSLDFQTLVQPQGAFSLLTSGWDGNLALADGGNITFNPNGALHVKIDQNRGNTVSLGGSNVGTYTPADTVGRGTLTFGGAHFDYYVLNAKVLRILEDDANVPVIGSAYAGVTGASNAMLNTQFVFTDSSSIAAGFENTTSTTFAVAGTLTADGNGNLTGFADVDENGHPTSAPVTGTYTVDSVGYGSITLTPGNAQDISVLGLYLTDPTINFSDPNSPADAGLAGLLLGLDTKLSGSGGVLILPAAGPSAPTGNFALSLQTSNASKETSAVGVVTITGTNLSGTLDFNDVFGAGTVAGAAISGALTADTTNTRRFTIPLTVNVATPVKSVIYQMSPTQMVVVEADSPQLGIGLLEQQH